MTWLIQFFVGILSVGGFCLIINIPRRSIIPASAIGGLAWLIYEYATSTGTSKALAAFWGAALVALLADICSRFFKEAATIYIIPGILPLVPGAGMYYTMVSLINSNYAAAIENATDTIFVAGSIALALLVVGSFIRIFTSIRKKIYWN